jgi:hypothetical protein
MTDKYRGGESVFKPIIAIDHFCANTFGGRLNGSARTRLVNLRTPPLIMGQGGENCYLKLLPLLVSTTNRTLVIDV